MFTVNPSVSILASVVKDQPRDIIDYSMHRTPSGNKFSSFNKKLTVLSQYY